MKHQWLNSTWPNDILWMMNKLIGFSKSRVSITTNMELQISISKIENEKQKCLLMIFFYFCFWKCVLHMLLQYNKSCLWFLSLHINYIKFIGTTRRNSRLDHVSYKYTEQIRKRYHRVPLDLGLSEKQISTRPISENKSTFLA